MTAITPLESIHKKGIFGEHHKKNESDLIRISEVKTFNIIQVVQFKRSKVKLENLNIDDTVERFMLSLDGKSTLVDISEQLNISYDRAKWYLNRFQENGLVE